MPQPEHKTRPWAPITPPPPDWWPSNGRFAALDALRAEWDRQLSALSEDERARRRQRSLRKLAVETGVLERLYDIDWGLTLTLVAEGFAREVIERAGGSIDDATLATLVAQREALEMVIDFVRDDRKLTPGLVKELHHAITRTQRTYTAVDLLGRVTEAQLPHGTWKTWANHVVRADGSILEYCPPEHVDSEVDRLTKTFEEMEQGNRFHPIVRAAWLHHRFVQIHPFADGNGRVARALTFLTLQRHHYAPLVVDRFHRGDYIAALDDANDGNLQPLVSLFVRLESSALVGELESWEQPTAGTSVEVAHTLAAQLAARRAKETEAIRRALEAKATYVSGLLQHWFDTKQEQLEGVFRKEGLKAEVLANLELRPDSERGHYYRRQVIDSARRAGHFADLGRFAGWARLVVIIEGVRVSYVASLHAAGRDPGVMAVTTFAVVGQVPPRGSPPDEAIETIDVPTTSDAFQFVHSETPEALASRSTELNELLDSGLTVALVELMRRV